MRNIKKNSDEFDPYKYKYNLKLEFSSIQIHVQFKLE